MANRQESPDSVAVDVLIVGAGPAGYMAGVTLARYGVSFRLIDQRTECVQSGQAGGGSQTSFARFLYEAKKRGGEIGARSNTRHWIDYCILNSQALQLNMHESLGRVAHWNTRARTFFNDHLLWWLWQSFLKWLEVLYFML